MREQLIKSLLAGLKQEDDAADSEATGERLEPEDMLLEPDDEDNEDDDMPPTSPPRPHTGIKALTVKPSPMRDRIKAGFTGKKRDRLGRENCYDQGKRVPCPDKEGSAQKPAGGYENKLPALKPNKKPWRAFGEESVLEPGRKMTDNERKWLAGRLSKLGETFANEADMPAWDNPLGWGRIELDKDKLLKEYGGEKGLQFLIDRGWISKNVVLGPNGARDRYNLTLTAKELRTMHLRNVQELRMPTTKSAVGHMVQVMLEESGRVYETIADYLGIRKQVDAWKKTLGGAEVEKKTYELVNEMLYRHYNPMPVWERAKSEQVQAKVKSIADLFTAANKSPELAEVTGEIQKISEEGDRMFIEANAIGEQLYGSNAVTDPAQIEALKAQEAALNKRHEELGTRLGELYNKRSELRRPVQEKMLNEILKVDKPTEVKVKDMSFTPGLLITKLDATGKMQYWSVNENNWVSDMDEAYFYPNQRMAYEDATASGLKDYEFWEQPAHSILEQAAVTSASSWLMGKVAQGPKGESLPAYKVIKDNFPSNGRAGPSAYYNSYNHAINVHTDMTSARTNVHEMGHGIEHKMPEAQSAAQRFLKYRVKDEPLIKLKTVLPESGYGPGEQGRHDKFGADFGDYRAWYVGKHYEYGATEIVSMGVEQLYVDPIRFAQKDPEYCGFILGILDGSCRDNVVPSY